MYTLPMTDAQRIQLVQSSLWTSDEQARNILFAPGGFRVMLPETLQLWLYPNVDIENECDESNATEATEASEAETKVDGDDLDCDEQVPLLLPKENDKRDASTNMCVVDYRVKVFMPPHHPRYLAMFRVHHTRNIRYKS